MSDPRLTVDFRSNRLILNTDPDPFTMIQDIVADPDVPGRRQTSVLPVTQLYNLRIADETSMAEILRGLVGSGPLTTKPVAEA